MAQQPPTMEQLLQLIQTLQAEVQTLQAGAANASNVAPANVQAAPAAVVFADTPSTLGVDNIINYKTKQGNAIFENGCKALDDKALTDGFNMCRWPSPSSSLRPFLARPPSWAGTLVLSRSLPSGTRTTKSSTSSVSIWTDQRSDAQATV